MLFWKILGLGRFINIKNRIGDGTLKTNTTIINNTQTTKTEPYTTPTSNSNGLADLQAYTTRVLNSASQWGFNNHKFKIQRHKLDNDTWQLTVINPKTLKTILQVEGHGDTIFAYEDKLAYMAEILTNSELTIRTPPC